MILGKFSMRICFFIEISTHFYEIFRTFSKIAFFYVESHLKSLFSISTMRWSYFSIFLIVNDYSYPQNSFFTKITPGPDFFGLMTDMDSVPVHIHFSKLKILILMIILPVRDDNINYNYFTFLKEEIFKNTKKMIYWCLSMIIIISYSPYSL